MKTDCYTYTSLKIILNLNKYLDISFNLNLQPNFPSEGLFVYIYQVKLRNILHKIAFL